MRDVNWLGAGSTIPADGIRVAARVRNTHEPVPAYLKPHDNPIKAIVEFDQPLFGVSPGQACVFYQEDCVIGGGWIIRDEVEQFVPHNKRLETLDACK